MAKAPSPAPLLPRPRRLFEPARYSQRYLASAYLQLVPAARRPLPVRPAGPAPAHTAPPATVAS